MRIWIDLSNSPHVPLFRPIMAELTRRGYEVGVTARDFAQTVALAEDAGLEVEVIGAHGGRGRARKAANIAARASELRRWARDWCPDTAVSHNSYAQLLAARWLGIPAVTMMDYEGQPANGLAFRLARRVILPEVFPASLRRRQGARDSKTMLYPGVKEQIYLWDFEPQKGFRGMAGLDEDKTLVVLRPPATMALYHDFENPLFSDLVTMLGARKDVQVVLLPRTPEQAEVLTDELPPNFVVPETPLDGPNLLAAADVVIGAGGTMNREAAVLGTPAYSIYAGKPAAVDVWLASQGLLRIVRDGDDLSRIVLRARPPVEVPLARGGKEVMDQVVRWMTECASS